MTDEEKYTKRNEKIIAFKKELKELMVKYYFGKTEHDNYNGMEEYCGTDIYFTINGETYYSETVNEIIDECI
tara:strand:+ start:749 stop:964 length:216 start_codon:yes stop_codon:yes gene_type:complete